MKTPNHLSQYFGNNARFICPNGMRLLWTMLLLCITFGCHDLAQDDVPVLPQDVKHENNPAWVDLISTLDFNSSIFVPRDESIQEAVNAAQSGNLIFVEPGLYSERLTIDRSDIHLIGLSNENGDRAVINNMQGKVDMHSLDSYSPDPAFMDFLRQLTTETVDGSALDNSARKRGRHRLESMEWERIGKGITHYTFMLRVGTGAYDVVRIHRVVRERHPFRPVPTKGSIFMVGGATQGFTHIYYEAGAAQIDAHTSSPVYLASKNIDVWGIDLAWTLVPLETTDFTFMKDWGMEKEIDHILSSLSFARMVRCLSSHRFDKINLLGFSYSVPMIYGAAGRETQKPRMLRHIKGLIPTDYIIKYPPEAEDWRQGACAGAANGNELLNNGEYVLSNGIGAKMMGDLVLTAPDEPSPIIPGLTNLEAMLAGMTDHASSGWHFFGGDLEGLYYTDTDRAPRLLSTVPPYQPFRAVVDNATCQCDEDDVSFDDHLGEITVPILYLGAVGGFGELGNYSCTLTASTDITYHNVSLVDDPSIDFGHADLWMAKDGDKLVWEKMRKWIMNRGKPWYM